MAAEESLINRLGRLSQGERLSLARRASDARPPSSCSIPSPVWFTPRWKIPV
jgi:hypothetical protein